MRHFILLLASFIFATPVFASGDSHGGMFPHIPEPEGKKCVQPEEEMRKNHMNYILHQRDETMYRGIRANIKNEGYSLAECIDCHVFPDENGKIATHDDPEHFCSTCHQYAAVKIDCFDCHADKPQEYIERGKKTAMEQHMQHYLASTPAAETKDMGNK